MIIIGISGKKGSGKDTVADIILQELRKGDSAKLSFAQKCYEEVALMLKAVEPKFRLQSTDVLVEYIRANKDNFRLVLQGWGTNVRRELWGEQYWIDQWVKEACKMPAEILLVPDVRFKNEYDIIKSMGGYMWRVERLPTYLDAHPSETDLDEAKFDFTLKNSGDLSYLKLLTVVALKSTIENHNKKYATTRNDSISSTTNPS